MRENNIPQTIQLHLVMGPKEFFKPLIFVIADNLC